MKYYFPKTSQTQGSDSYFSQELAKKEFVFYWSKNSIVYEDIPFKRSSVKWYIKRRFRIGYSNNLIIKNLDYEHFKIL